MEKNRNKNIMIHSLWDTAKAVLRGKFIVIQSYLKKQEKSHINNLTLYLNRLEKEQQTKPKTSKRKEIIKITAKINDVDNKKEIEQINETRSWFFEKIKELIKL